MRAPQLNNGVVDSLAALLAGMQPVDYLGTDKEPAVKYLAALVQHYRLPASIAKREAIAAYTKTYKENKKP